MPNITFLGAHDLLIWATTATAELVARRDEINALNVFPVPDSDTGSNMAHTMTAAVKQAQSVDNPDDLATVAMALATGAVKGARGNSGVVLSQVLRGIAHHADSGRIDAHVIQEALRSSLDFVATAISDPVEGTVITVLRAAAIAATNSTDSSLATVVHEAAHAARTALAETPSQLQVLREAKVVDAGGQGLVILLDCLEHVVTGNASPYDGQTPDTAEQPQQTHGTSGYLEVMCFIEGVEVSHLHDLLAPLGDCLVIGPISETSATVHIHSTDAATVISTLYATGTITDLHIEVLPETPKVVHPKRIVLALTPPGDLAQLYTDAGALVVVRDGHHFAIARSTNLGQAETPLADGIEIVNELVARSHQSGAQEVILLPNGLLTTQEMAAVERSSQAFKQSITMLPTGSLVRGLAALSVHDPQQSLAVATYAMTEAMS
ncbi:DAK2 domain-containing protein [Corynebacterium diphtheriae]|nr:DAK2 domain-containing protein [Corynebacterium diphtheriae]